MSVPWLGLRVLELPHMHGKTLPVLARQALIRRKGVETRTMRHSSGRGCVMSGSPDKVRKRKRSPDGKGNPPFCMEFRELSGHGRLQP